jgi:hypothetical protein
MDTNTVKRPFYKRTWFKITGIVFGVLFLISLFSDPKAESGDAHKQDSPPDTKEIISTSSPAEAEETNKVSYSKIGDVISVGNFVYKVNGIKYQKTIGDEGYGKTSDGIYLIVNLSLKNMDSKEHTIDNSLFKLTDADGTEFESSTEADLALEMTGLETLFLKQCNPKINKKGYLCFEVPEKGTYDLHLSGGYWEGSTAIVKLTNK